MVTEQHIWHPHNRWLFWGICLSQVLLIAVPFLRHDMMSAIVVVGFISVVALFGSLTTAVLYLCFIVAVVPTWFFGDYLTLPLDFKFYEGLFGVVMVLAGILWMLEGRLNWRKRTRLDRPMLVFLGLVLFSCVLGVLYGQSLSQMLRDVRYPLYYSLFFLVTWFFDRKRFSIFLYLLVLAAAVVGIQYLFEFFFMVNTAIAGSFFRVARLEGVILPIGILIFAAVLLYEPQFHRRMFALVASVPIGLALILTMGRGMWVSVFAGLFSVVGLALFDPQLKKKRTPILVVFLIPVLLLGVGYLFQKQTGAGVGEMALRRVTRATQNHEQDHSVSGRLVSYGVALRKIAQRPLLGSGHGATVTYLITDVTPPEVLTVGGVDNLYLTIGMRMGIVGVAAFLWVYLAGLWWAFQLFLKSEDRQIRVFCASFCAVYSAMLVYGLVDGTLFINRFIFIHATFLGLIAQLANDACLRQDS